jgi:DNA-binding protein YbaB
MVVSPESVLLKEDQVVLTILIIQAIPITVMGGLAVLFSSVKIHPSVVLRLQVDQVVLTILIIQALQSTVLAGLAAALDTVHSSFVQPLEERVAQVIAIISTASTVMGGLAVS